MALSFPELLERFFYRPDEDLTGLEAFESLPDDATVPVADERPMDFLGFRLEGEAFAVPIEKVREILRVGVLTEVPRGGPHLLGVLTLRGEVTPIYDLKPRLSLTEKAPYIAGPLGELNPLPREARILVLRSEEGPAGVLVDGVDGVVPLMPSAVEPPPRLWTGPVSEWVTGLGRREGQLYILLDVERALAG